MFDKELLENFRKVYNSEHEDKIKDSDDVWSELKRKMHSKCKTGRVECIVAHLMNKPKAPQSWMVNPTEWLSSIDIENVEKQYMKLFKKYKFLGCIPIDFDLKSKILKTYKYSADIKAAEDLDLWMKLAMNGYRFGNCQEILLNYRSHNKQGSKTTIIQDDVCIYLSSNYANYYFNSIFKDSSFKSKDSLTDFLSLSFINF